ncbi:MAG: hypothetical protein SGPRY_000846 [Prymnesium sp.]
MGRRDAAIGKPPRLCASRHEKESWLQQESCLPGCSRFNCSQCRCRHCDSCRCTDPLGQTLEEPMCSHSWDTHYDVPLGRVNSHALNQAVFGILLTVGSFACSAPVAARLARAYTQATRAGIFVRVLHMSRDDGRSSHSNEDSTATEILANALSPVKLEEAVSFIGIKQLREVFPSLLQQMRRIKWHDRRRPLWLANGCDLPMLAYFARHSSSLPPSVQHLWVIQHDVGWTEELPLVLSGIGATGPIREADLICDDPYVADKSWLHFNERTYLHDDETSEPGGSRERDGVL